VIETKKEVIVKELSKKKKDKKKKKDQAEEDIDALLADIDKPKESKKLSKRLLSGITIIRNYGSINGPIIAYHQAANITCIFMIFIDCYHSELPEVTTSYNRRKTQECSEFLQLEIGVISL
jgi:hypothetical protein